jgi:hypothetical protein
MLIGGQKAAFYFAQAGTCSLPVLFIYFHGGKMNAPDFVSKRISRSAVIRLDAPLERVFPLFGALREKDWAEGWDPIFLSDPDGKMQERLVFQTSAAHGHTEGRYTWLVSKYLPEQGQVEYTVFTPERVWWIAIRCWEVAGQTLAEVNYTYCGLSEKGNAINEAALARMFAEDLKNWQRAINHYLKTGECLGVH